METLELLQEVIGDYQGTVLFVSHDREFISSLATRIIELKPGKVFEHTNIENRLLEKAEA